MPDQGLEVHLNMATVRVRRARLDVGFGLDPLHEKLADGEPSCDDHTARSLSLEIVHRGLSVGLRAEAAPYDALSLAALARDVQLERPCAVPRVPRAVRPLELRAAPAELPTVAVDHLGAPTAALLRWRGRAMRGRCRCGI